MDILSDALELFQPLSKEVTNLKDNPITVDKIELGKQLFFGPRLSASGVFSCHSLATGDDDNLETSIGYGWQEGPRNAPTVLNSVFNTAQFWDGRAADPKEQAKGPIQADVEMANTPSQVEQTLKSMPAYVDTFGKAFPTEKDKVTFDHMAKAIEAFQATLLTPSPFDKFLGGDNNVLTNKKIWLEPLYG